MKDRYSVIKTSLLRTCSSQSELTQLKISEISARALFLSTALRITLERCFILSQYTRKSKYAVFKEERKTGNSFQRLSKLLILYSTICNKASLA